MVSGTHLRHGSLGSHTRYLHSLHDTNILFIDINRLSGNFHLPIKHQQGIISIRYTTDQLRAHGLS